MFMTYLNLQLDRVEELVQLLPLDYCHLLMEQIKWDLVEGQQHMQIYMGLDLHQV